MIKYSIIIPTYNGGGRLEKCLLHLALLKNPKDDFEIIVIDNGSTDNTKLICESFNNKFNNLEYFYDATPGLLTGRHVGATESKGEILCFIDDDSFVDKNWLLGIEKTFSNPEVVLAGGPNTPYYEEKQTKWLKYFWTSTPYGNYMGELSLIDFYKKEMKVPTWFVFGCNFIIKKDILFKYGGFNPDCMPPTLQRLQGDGETALSLKLQAAGYMAHYNPQIKNNHLVPRSRMTLEYFKKRAFYQGVCDSFTQIRKENGFEYSDLNINEKIKAPFFLRKYNKIIKPFMEKYLYKFDSNYIIYLNMKEEYKLSYKEGFEFHQNEVKNDPELLKWVLKENYLD